MAKVCTGINQTAISFKCDTINLEKLNNLCQNLGCNRNKLLNFLVDYAIRNLDRPIECNLINVYGSVMF